jgi:hypothetical protein
MPEVLRSPFEEGAPVDPVDVLLRLVIALALGLVVAWVYRRTRGGADFTATFPPTLVLLAVLIAMVTQVIGDNVARAFSLVGALSIVRFRTVVRDTQDTAFVIFAVVVGMAVGAQNPWVAMIGIVVVSLAAFIMMHRPTPSAAVADTPFRLDVRVASGYDPEGAMATTIDAFVADRRLVSVGTARQGMALGVSYSVRFRKGKAPEELVKALNRIEGVQNVELTLREATEL